MEFDLELAKAETSENPVFYVQYAHARLCAVLRAASERGIEFEDGDVSLLTTHQELALMRRLNELPDVIARSAEMLEPHHMPHFAYEVARELQRFYEACRVISSDPADAGDYQGAVTACRCRAHRACRDVEHHGDERA